jgi:uncharacterized protein (TIGR00369 family)
VRYCTYIFLNIRKIFVNLHLIMNVENTKERLGDGMRLDTTLGMEFISTPEDDICVGRMPVDERHIQPMGFLSGGATLALAETMAGVASMTLCPDAMCVGISVSANHLHAARKGDMVTAKAQLIHRGGQTHVWRIDITNTTGKLISTVTVTNFIKQR